MRLLLHQRLRLLLPQRLLLLLHLGLQAVAPAAGALSFAGVTGQQLHHTSVGVQLTTKPEHDTASRLEQAQIQIVVQHCCAQV
jgi:hypothetical protein